MSRHDRAVTSEEVLSLRFDALADGNRRRILELLRTRGEVTAGALAAEFPEISRPAVSRHLRVLRESGLVDDTQVGREIRYALAADALDALWHNWFAAFATISEGALGRLRDRVTSQTDDRGNYQTGSRA